MDTTQLLLVAITGGASAGFAVWKAAAYNNPAKRWPKLAPELELKFETPPPKLAGRWKNREASLVAQESTAVAVVPLKAAAGLRLEIGPKAEVEKAAGMVVPDRLTFDEDRAFSEVFAVRSTPKEAGQRAIDPMARQKALAIKGFRLLATSTELRVTAELPREADAVRDLLDLAVSLAEVLDG